MVSKLVIFGFLSLALPTCVMADQMPAWGKVVCTAVAQADAVTFANQNHFLDNWDYEKFPDPPYVAPAGTLSCMLPVKVTTVSNDDDGPAYSLSVDFINAPFHVPDCQVSYYDGTPTRTFAADGDGDGYLDPSSVYSDFTAEFDDLSQSKFDSDSFMAIDIAPTPSIQWAGEAQDDKPHVAIVSSCSLQF